MSTRSLSRFYLISKETGGGGEMKNQWIDNSKDSLECQQGRKLAESHQEKEEIRRSGKW